MNNNKTNDYFSRGGLTLIEAIIVISVSTIVIVAIASTIVFFYRSHSYTMEQVSAINSARKGIDVAVKNIREAVFSEEGGYPVILINANEFSFYSNIDYDDKIERVRLFLENGTVKMGIIKPGGLPLSYSGQPEELIILSNNVRNAEESINIFKYYANDGTEIIDYANVLDVFFVRIKLIVNINPTRLPNNFELNSSATLRNLQDRI